MKILVTGGAGFIGSNFIKHMLKKYQGYKIVNLDKLTYCGNLGNLTEIEDNPNYEFVHGDICDKKLVIGLSKDCDGIIHFAAESHVDNSIEKPDEFISTNVIGTLSLLEAARINKVKRFLYMSTDEVYGSIQDGSFDESSLLHPNSPYSASKAAAEHLVTAYFTTHRVPSIITRSSNNFGPNQYPEKLIPLFITNLLEGKNVPLYGTGLNVRDWIYVKDECAGLDFVFHQGKDGEIYNISGNNEKKNIEITETVLALLGKDKESIDYVADRLGHDLRYSLKSEKLKELGWSPTFDFEEALKETVKWYRENELWWKPLKKTKGANAVL